MLTQFTSSRKSSNGHSITAVQSENKIFPLASSHTISITSSTAWDIVCKVFFSLEGSIFVSSALWYEKNPITVINYIIIYAVNSCSKNLWHQIEIKGPSRKDFVSLRRDFSCCHFVVFSDWLLWTEQKNSIMWRLYENFLCIKIPVRGSTYFFTTKSWKVRLIARGKKPKILKCHHSIYTHEVPLKHMGKMCKFLLTIFTWKKNCTYEVLNDSERQNCCNFSLIHFFG